MSLELTGLGKQIAKDALKGFGEQVYDTFTDPDKGRRQKARQERLEEINKQAKAIQEKKELWEKKRAEADMLYEEKKVVSNNIYEQQLLEHKVKNQPLWRSRSQMLTSEIHSRNMYIHELGMRNSEYIYKLHDESMNKNFNTNELKAKMQAIKERIVDQEAANEKNKVDLEKVIEQENLIKSLEVKKAQNLLQLDEMYKQAVNESKKLANEYVEDTQTLFKDSEEFHEFVFEDAENYISKESMKYLNKMKELTQTINFYEKTIISSSRDTTELKVQVAEMKAENEALNNKYQEQQAFERKERIQKQMKINNMERKIQVANSNLSNANQHLTAQRDAFVNKDIKQLNKMRDLQNQVKNFTEFIDDLQETNLKEIQVTRENMLQTQKFVNEERNRLIQEHKKDLAIQKDMYNKYRNARKKVFNELQNRVKADKYAHIEEIEMLGKTNEARMEEFKKETYFEMQEMKNKVVELETHISTLNKKNFTTHDEWMQTEIKEIINDQIDNLAVEEIEGLETTFSKIGTIFGVAVGSGLLLYQFADFMYAVHKMHKSDEELMGALHRLKYMTKDEFNALKNRWQEYLIKKNYEKSIFVGISEGLEIPKPMNWEDLRPLAVMDEDLKVYENYPLALYYGVGDELMVGGIVHCTILNIDWKWSTDQIIPKIWLKTTNNVIAARAITIIEYLDLAIKSQHCCNISLSFSKMNIPKIEIFTLNMVLNVENTALNEGLKLDRQNTFMLKLLQGKLLKMLYARHRDRRALTEGGGIPIADPTPKPPPVPTPLPAPFDTQKQPFEHNVPPKNKRDDIIVVEDVDDKNDIKDKKRKRVHPFFEEEVWAGMRKKIKEEDDFKKKQDEKTKKNPTIKDKDLPIKDDKTIPKKDDGFKTIEDDLIVVDDEYIYNEKQKDDFEANPKPISTNTDNNSVIKRNVNALGIEASEIPNNILTNDNKYYGCIKFVEVITMQEFYYDKSELVLPSKKSCEIAQDILNSINFNTSADVFQVNSYVTKQSLVKSIISPNTRFWFKFVCELMKKNVSKGKLLERIQEIAIDFKSNGLFNTLALEYYWAFCKKTDFVIDSNSDCYKAIISNKIVNSFNQMMTYPFKKNPVSFGLTYPNLNWDNDFGERLMEYEILRFGDKFTIKEQTSTTKVDEQRRYEKNKEEPIEFNRETLFLTADLLEKQNFEYALYSRFNENDIVDESLFEINYRVMTQKDYPYINVKRFVQELEAEFVKLLNADNRTAPAQIMFVLKQLLRIRKYCHPKTWIYNFKSYFMKKGAKLLQDKPKVIGESTLQEFDFLGEENLTFYYY